MEPTATEITRHHDEPPGSDPYVEGYVPIRTPIAVVEHDPSWAADFARVAELVHGALTDRALAVHHVGSTSVPDLPAKPVIDADLVVTDPAEEAAYVPDLVAAGFVHVLREPWWHEHRLLKLVPPAGPLTHLHVFGPGCPEVVRHTMFRDWLLAHADEREAYAAAKRAAASATNEVGGTGMDYNRLKEQTVRAIYDRCFRAHGLLP